MSAFTALNRASARAHLAVSKAIGIQVQYSNRSGAPITLYATVRRDDASMVNLIGTRSTEQAITFRIAMQPINSPIFPPLLDNGPALNDVITWDGVDYRVDSWSDVGGVDGGVFEIKGVSTTARQIGKVD